MVPIIVAAIGAVTVLISTLMSAELGRRRHLALIKAEADALTAIPEGFPKREILEFSLREQLRAYHLRNNPARPRRRALIQYRVGLAIYLGGVLAVSVYWQVTTGTTTSPIAISTTLIPAAVGAAIGMPAYRKHVRYRRQKRLMEQIAAETKTD